ncbi:flagellin [Ruegeria arenilitoris]|uniref:Flagellar hook-associated protein FlgL n=1 Tax=Ruegeria arenilitoris TaxID=1173585 RepID=A0A238KHA7_9RHOB|nr:flagellin [Ruegeria arenilitoris]SMX42171.1 flagellar hook-associated protein FlgL [Ruegeria arenilitoris]
MTLNSIGDLARGLTLRARSTEIKTQIETLSYEMSTGKTADISGRLSGDYSHLLDLDRKIAQLDAFSTATAEADLFADATQISLETFETSIGEVSASLLAFGTSNQATSHAQASAQARNELDTMISSLNTRVGGRSLFAGTATDASPLQSTDTLLAALRTELAGLTTLTDIRQAAEDWFNDPAGFEAVMYNGSNTTLAPMQISETERVNMQFTANDPKLRDGLRDVALAALATEGALGWPPDLQTALFTDLGVALANTKDDVVTMRAQIGAAQARIEQAETRNAAARTSFEYARNELVAANPYKTAAHLQTVQFQLESLYSVTVRNSTLSLVNFLR